MEVYMSAKYERLTRMRMEIQRDREKIEKMREQLKAKEAKLKEAEATQIVADVNTCDIKPEELWDILQLAKSGKLNEYLTRNTDNARTDGTTETEELEHENN
jgi:Skp family chaperone for outer membrane proteins